MTKNNRNFGGMGTRWGISLLRLVLLAAPLASQAEILEAELRVDGLVCPFCAFGIEKKLRAVQGVQEVEVLLDEGRVRLAFRPGNAATVGALEEAVDKSGFELSGVKLKVQGTLATDSANPILDAGGKVRFWLLEADNGRMKPLSDAALEKLRRGARNGVVAVNGTLHAHAEGLPGLLVSGAESGAWTR